jgi:predicted ATPase
MQRYSSWIDCLLNGKSSSVQKTKKNAKFIDEWLERDYTALGYGVVRVPVFPPRERLVFVQERLSEIELSL